MGVPIPQQYVVDLTGSVIDRLTIIKEVNPYQVLNGSKQWYCKCECGEECIRTTKVLVHKTEVSKPKSCGTCYKCMDPGTSRGKLTIIDTVDGAIYHKLGNPFSYNVKCECGAVTVMTEVEFRNRKYCTKCDDRWEYVKQVNTKHGDAPGGKRSKLLNHHRNMINRAASTGIPVCTEWEDYAVFKAWSLANGFTEDISLSLIRIDESQGFFPENCRFIPSYEKYKQNTNTILIGGKTESDWSVERLISMTEIREAYKTKSDIEMLHWLSSLPLRSELGLVLVSNKIISAEGATKLIEAMDE